MKTSAITSLNSTRDILGPNFDAKSGRFIGNLDHIKPGSIILPGECDLLTAPILTDVHISDVGDHPISVDETLTVLARTSRLRDSDTQFFTVPNADHLPYNAYFLAELRNILIARIREVISFCECRGIDIPKRVLEDIRALFTHVIHGLLNAAPRNLNPKIQSDLDSQHTIRNGDDFWVSILPDEKTVLTAVPIWALSLVRDRVGTLLRCPRDNNPLLHPDEQYGSSLARGITSDAPDALTVEYRRGQDDPKILDNLLPPVRGEFVAYRDHPFHNLFVWSEDIPKLFDQLRSEQNDDSTSRVAFGNSVVRLRIGTSLRKGQAGQWQAYTNPTDTNGQHGSGIVEFTRLWDVGKTYRDKGQLPTSHLAKRVDREVGTKVHVVKKNAPERRILTADYFIS